jgi:hypothetical protein
MLGGLIMATATLEERYAVNLHGLLSCFDQIIIAGIFPAVVAKRTARYFFFNASMHWLRLYPLS